MNGSRTRARVVMLITLAVLAMLLVMGAGIWWGWGHWNSGMIGWGGMWFLVPVAAMALMMYAMMGHGRMGHGRGGHGSHRGHSDEARAVLDRRYAAGEISQEEYTRIRDDLETRQ